MIYYVAIEDFKIILYSLGTMVPGYVLYLFSSRNNRTDNFEIS
jgi:hypothetical protein